MTREWLQQKERSTPAALRTIRWIAMHLGRRPARALLYPITLYYLAFAPRARHHSRTFLERVRGGRPGVLAVARHMHTFAAVILDRVFLLAGREQVLDVTVDHPDELEAALRERRGALLLGAHFGSFEVLRALAVAREGYPVKVLMHRHHNALLTQLLDELNPAVADTVIDLGDPAAALRVGEAIQEGALVGVLADRTLGSDEPVRCTFLGGEAEFPASPMRLAAVLGAPVFLFFGVYQGGNRYHIRFETLTEGEVVPRPERRSWVEARTCQFARRLEAQVREAPETWFNFYDFWRGSAPH